MEEPPAEVGLNCWLLLLGFTLSKGMPLVFDEPLRYPAPVQMSGEELGVNTHRVFSLLRWVIIDLTPTLMLEKVGRGVEEEVEEEREAVWDIPLLSFICSVVNNGFQALSPANSPLASNFTSPLFSLCFSGFLAKSFFKSESVDPLCFSTSTLRALRGDVAILPLDPSSAKLSFSPCLLESFTGLSLFNPWVGSKVEPDVSTPKLSLTTLSSWWYSNTTLGTSNTK